MPGISVVVINSCTSDNDFTRNSCLSISSSLITSSRSSTGSSPVSSLIMLISASFSESAAVRCCPCEPKFRALIPSMKNSRSSLCGPLPVVRLFRSCSNEFLSSLYIFSSRFSLHSSPEIFGA